MKTFDACARPRTSPWGGVQTATEIAPGIWQVSTASHGGLKLSRQRNAAMPVYMRTPGGWYEEDCAWALVAVAFPAAFKAADVTAATDTLRNWFANEYERFFGVTLTPAESRQRAQEQFERDAADKYVVRSAWGDWALFVPRGMVGVVATLGGKAGAERWFLVAADEYAGCNFIIDPARHAEIDAPDAHARFSSRASEAA